MVENKYWYMGKFKKIVLTEYGKNYLIKLYRQWQDLRRETDNGTTAGSTATTTAGRRNG